MSPRFFRPLSASAHELVVHPNGEIDGDWVAGSNGVRADFNYNLKIN